MKISISILFTCVIHLAAFSQEFDFDIHNKTLKDFIKMEGGFNSQQIPNTSNYISGKGIAQPLRFLREQKVIPDLISQYFYYEEDSTIAYILYEWDVYNFEKEDNNKQSAEVQKSLINKYNDLESQVTAKFGEGEVEGSLTEFSRINEKGGLTKKNIWKPNDSTEIEMYTAISNFYEKQGMITRNPTHRIRLFIRNTTDQKDDLLKLDESKIKAFNKVTTSFLNAIRKGKYEESKKFLSDIIVGQVKIEQLKALRKNVDFKQEIQPFFNGIQMGPNGEIFTLVQYKYANDKSSPPTEMIKVVFDSNVKIVVIQPLKIR